MNGYVGNIFLGLIVCLLVSIGGTYAAYQNQGFTTYTTNYDGTIAFSCQKQCVILLDEGFQDILLVSGTIIGNGNIGYGYMIDNAVYPGGVLNTKSGPQYEWNITSNPIHKQFTSSNAKLALLFDGPITTNNIVISLRNKSLGEKWTQFWTPDGLAPYSINLRYGPSRGTWSWPTLAFVLLLITALIILISQKNTILSASKKILFGGVIIMMLGGIRLLVDNVTMTQKGMQTFAGKADGRFFDLDDYITVTKKIRGILDLDNIQLRKGKTCTIYAKTHQEWPFNVHWLYVYMRPCKIVPTITEAEYTIFYKVQPTVMQHQTVLGTGDSFIFIKN